MGVCTAGVPIRHPFIMSQSDGAKHRLINEEVNPHIFTKFITKHARPMFPATHDKFVLNATLQHISRQTSVSPSRLEYMILLYKWEKVEVPLSLLRGSAIYNLNKSSEVDEGDTS